MGDDETSKCCELAEIGQGSKLWSPRNWGCQATLPKPTVLPRLHLRRVFTPSADEEPRELANPK